MSFPPVYLTKQNTRLNGGWRKFITGLRDITAARSEAGQVCFSPTTKRVYLSSVNGKAPQLVNNILVQAVYTKCINWNWAAWERKPQTADAIMFIHLICSSILYSICTHWNASIAVWIWMHLKSTPRLQHFGLMCFRLNKVIWFRIDVTAGVKHRLIITRPRGS